MLQYPLFRKCPLYVAGLDLLVLAQTSRAMQVTHVALSSLGLYPYFNMPGIARASAVLSQLSQGTVLLRHGRCCMSFCLEQQSWLDSGRWNCRAHAQSYPRYVLRSAWAVGCVCIDARS